MRNINSQIGLASPSVIPIGLAMPSPTERDSEPIISEVGCARSPVVRSIHQEIFAVQMQRAPSIGDRAPSEGDRIMRYDTNDTGYVFLTRTHELKNDDPSCTRTICCVAWDSLYWTREQWNGTDYRILDPDDPPTDLMRTGMQCVMHVIREQRAGQLPYAFFLGPCATPIAGNSHLWQLFSSYAPAIPSELTLIF